MRTQKPVILIVDDSVLLLDRMVEVIEDSAERYNLAYAATYRQALEQLERLKPQLAFFDIGLPDGNGIDLLRKVREQYLDTQVVMVSNQDNEYYKKTCFALGAKLFLDKSADFCFIPGVIEALCPTETNN